MSPSHKVCIVAVGVADVERLAELDAHAAFRKATQNMRLAHLALGQALTVFDARDSHFKEQLKNQMGLFLGTGHGEFNTTLDFLKSWSQQKLARPFVFQNSLHNSTTGFLSLNEGYRAPSCTTSHHYFSGEDSLDLAMQFILTGMNEICAVVGVDGRTSSLLPQIHDAGFPNEKWGQGAGAVILASEKYCEENKLEVLGCLDFVECSPCLSHPIFKVEADFDLSSFYDSHAVEMLAQSIENNVPEVLLLKKPNGGHSKISWSSTRDKYV